MYIYLLRKGHFIYGLVGIKNSKLVAVCIKNTHALQITHLQIFMKLVVG